MSLRTKLQNYRNRKLREKIVNQMIGHTDEHHRVHANRLKKLNSLSRELKYRDMRNKAYYGVKNAVHGSITKTKVAVKEHAHRHKMRISDSIDKVKQTHSRIREFRYKPDRSHKVEFFARAMTTLVIIASAIFYVKGFISWKLLLILALIVVFIDFVLYYVLARP